MDTYEATKVVMSRIQTLDPENASKIMGYILLQDQGDKELIRLAFGPETLLHSYINQAKTCLGIPSNTPSSNPPTPLSNLMRPNNHFPPRISIPTNGFHFSNPSSPAAAFQRTSPRPFSYAAALNNSTNNNNNNSNSSNNINNNNNNNNGLDYEFGNHLSFLDDSLVDPIMSPSGRSDSLVFPYGDDAGSILSPHPHPHPHPFHRRSCSVNDAAFLANLEEGGVNSGWRPCMYFARGFCKNGGTCKFSHSDIGEGIDVGSPTPSKNLSGFDELLRIKALQQQRFAAMAAAGGHHPFAYNKCMDLRSENPRNEFSPMGLIGAANSSSRQIYLTFPADSTFKEEDVSSYFSMFGPVQDVRIPYQQKRMFGFVTFLYSETVKLILAKGNPHFVCDSRVLVKPYKEKGKIPDKKQQHHLERGDYSACLSPSAIDSRENIDHLPFGSRMLFNTQEMMLRRKLEQEAELQHAIELQGRRLMNLQLMDLKNQHNNHHLLPSFRGAAVPISSPRRAQLFMSQNFIPTSENTNHENSEEFDGSRESAKSLPLSTDQKLLLEGTESSTSKQHHVNNDESDFPESLEHILPDNLFSSPTKLVGERKSIFSQTSASSSTDDSTKPVTMSSSNIACLKSCHLQMPRLSPGQEAIEM
ncbi:hypothetical protein OROMI_016230 [Orobanche minor]